MNAEKTIFSKAHRTHISKALKGKPKSPEHKAKIAEGMKRRVQERKMLKEQGRQPNQ